MTVEAEVIRRIEVALARVEERLAAHCAFEDSRKVRLAPWISTACAVVSCIVAVLALTRH